MSTRNRQRRKQRRAEKRQLKTRELALEILNKIPSFAEWWATKGRAKIAQNIMEKPSMAGLALLRATAPEERD